MRYSRTSYVRRGWYIPYTYLYILRTLVLDLRKSKMGLIGVLYVTSREYCNNDGTASVITAVNWTRTSSSTSTVHLTAATYHGHLVDTVSLRTAWETLGGGTVGRLGKVRIWHRSTVPGYIHNLNLMMQCLYYFGVPRYAFSTENIICIGYTHNKWQKQDSINLSPPQSNSNNNQRTNSLIGIQKTLMAYIFLFESKKKFFSQRWSYQRCSHEFFRHFAQVR
jgi:hypothetical protein